MIKRAIVGFICTLLTCSYASHWAKDLTLNGSMSVSDVSNWSQGGDDSFSWNTNIIGHLTQTKNNGNVWGNTLAIDYGQSTIAGESSKTADRFSFLSQYAFGKSQFKPFISLDVLTQLSQGVNEDGIVESYIFDPLYLTESVGMEYVVNPQLQFQLGVGNKSTIISNSTVTESNSELGIGVTSFYKTAFFTKLHLDSSLRLFFASSTLNETDVVGKLSLTYPINTYIKWFYNINLIYDKDVSDEIQTQQQNTLGLSVSLK